MPIHANAIELKILRTNKAGALHAPVSETISPNFWLWFESSILLYRVMLSKARILNWNGWSLRRWSDSHLRLRTLQALLPPPTKSFCAFIAGVKKGNTPHMSQPISDRFANHAGLCCGRSHSALVLSCIDTCRETNIDLLSRYVTTSQCFCSEGIVLPVLRQTPKKSQSRWQNNQGSTTWVTGLLVSCTWASEGK